MSIKKAAAPAVADTTALGLGTKDNTTSPRVMSSDNRQERVARKRQTIPSKYRQLYDWASSLGFNSLGVYRPPDLQGLEGQWQQYAVLDHVMKLQIRLYEMENLKA